jgi:hypothetical protein
LAGVSSAGSAPPAFIADVHGIVTDVRVFDGDEELPLEQEAVALGG